MAMGATGPVMRAISRRRSHRQQWAVFEIIAMLILDTWLVRIAFDLAYDVRFNLIPQNTFLNTILNYIHTNLAENASHAKGGIGIPPPGNFELLRISITIGLVAIFALKGLYKIRLTGTWFRQVVTIASSATIGLAVLITYFFVFQPPSSSRLIVPFV